MITKQKNIILYVLIILFLANINLFARYENDFILMASNARTNALAGRIISDTAINITPIANPASLVGISSISACYTADHFGDFSKNDLLSVSLPLLDANAAFSVSLFRSYIDNIQITNTIDTANLDFDKITMEDASDYLLSISYSKLIYKGKLALGATAKLIRQNPYKDWTAYGAGVDAGMQLRLKNGIIPALYIRNLTTTIIKWHSENYEKALPEVYTGVSFYKNSPYFSGSLAFFLSSADITGNSGVSASPLFYFTETQDSYNVRGTNLFKDPLNFLVSTSIGVEYTHESNALSLRLASGNGTIISGGAGFSINGPRKNTDKISIDYAFSVNSFYTNIHKVSISISTK